MYNTESRNYGLEIIIGAIDRINWGRPNYIFVFINVLLVENLICICAYTSPTASPLKAPLAQPKYELNLFIYIFKAGAVFNTNTVLRMHLRCLKINI